MIFQKIILIIIPVLISISFSVPAQNSFDYQVMKGIHSGESVIHEHYYKPEFNSTNELRNILTGLYFGYKLFISSQDSRNCSFTPSCSEYAVQAFEKKGVTGILAAFDRLTRCNGMNRENYKTDPESGLLIDPVEDSHK